MIHSLRALATRTSWPHSSSTLLTHGEWVPASMAMRIGWCSEAKRRLRASGVVRSLPSSIASPLSVSTTQRKLYLSPRSIPTVIDGFLLLTSHMGRSSFLGVRARIKCLQTIRYCVEGRPSHLIFVECRQGEAVRRIHLLGRS